MMTPMGEIVLIRHGETEWSVSGRHTGRTDIELTGDGERRARAIGRSLDGRSFATVVASPAQRARRTAELAGLDKVDIDPDLWEWDYGGYDGVTTAEIVAERPGWSLWREGVIPGDSQHPGETISQVGARVDRVLDRARSALDGGGDVALVAHGHVLRILTARWLGLPALGGALFALDTATLSTLGFEHERPVILRWNLTPQ